MTVDPGFPSRIVRWPWAVTPGLQEARVFHWKDAAGAPYDPGTVTAKAGMDGMIAATVTGTGATRTITWSSGQTSQIPGSQWRLNFDGHDWVGGRVGIAEPEDAPSTEDEWTIQLSGDAEGDGLTITVLGGGGAQRFGASVVLHTDSLTPSSGDSVFWVAYTPGHVDAGGPGGSQRVPNDWQVVEAYEWGDESWDPPEGGTDVLLLMGEDSWPSKLATATNGALTVKDVPGLTVVPVGCGGAYGSGEGTALWMARNFEGFNGAPSPVAPAVDFVPVVIGARSVLSDGFTGRLAGLNPNLGAVLDMIDAGLDDHYVALFVADGDYSGGTFTAATLYDTGYPVPRENLVGAPVCVVSGNDMGLWTITASGPCTPGRTIDPGDVIRAYGQGLVALAGSSNGVDVSGINVAATHETVRGIGEDLASLQGQANDLADTAGTQGTTLDTLGNEVSELDKLATEAANGLDMLTTAAVTTPPLAWAECGWGNTAGDQERGYWRCTTLLPRPTTSLFAVFTARSLSGSTEEDDLYQELGSECLDSGGIPGAGGNDDLTEFAFRYHNGRLSTYDEWSAYGALMEWHRSQDPQVPAPEGFGVPPKTWVIVAKAVPDFSTGTILMLALSDHGMYIDPWLNLRWKVLQTYEMGEPYSMAESNGVEQWRGRGGGRFDIARARYFYDDVEVSDFDGLMGANGGTTITDRVLLDGNGDPATWEAQINAVNVNND